MPGQNRKNKMISLRISEEEYSALRARFLGYGARNVSDLARMALQRVIAQSPEPQTDLQAKVNELDHRLNLMEAHLSRLLELEKVMA